MKKDSDISPTEDKVKPKERILEASLTLFVEKGYFNTNIPDISKLSSCSVGSIYHHFVNKEEIAKELYQKGIDQFREALADEFEDTLDLKTILRNMVITFLTFAETHATLSRYLWLSRHEEFLTDKISKPTMVGFDNLGRKLTKLIKNGIRSGEIPDIKAEIFWCIVFGIPQSYIRDWLEGYAIKLPHTVAPQLANACWAGLQGAVKK